MKRIIKAPEISDSPGQYLSGARLQKFPNPVLAKVFLGKLLGRRFPPLIKLLLEDNGLILRIDPECWKIVL